MVRPCRFRMIGFEPSIYYFKPRGIPLSDLEEVVLGLDELEAIRLADLDGLYQEQAAERMKVSRQTFARIIDSAHRKISDALVNGKALRIQGGEIMFQTTGGGGGFRPGMRPGGKRGRGGGGGGGGGGRVGGGGYGRGKMGGVGAGPAGTCVCPNCGQQIAHSPGVPCASLKCPNCGSQMVRG